MTSKLHVINQNHALHVTCTIKWQNACLCSSSVPGIPRQGGQAAASIHFSDWGGGVKVRKMPNFSARFARKVPISNFSRKAPRKNENCVCLVVFLC